MSKFVFVLVPVKCRVSFARDGERVLAVEPPSIQQAQSMRECLGVYQSEEKAFDTLMRIPPPAPQFVAKLKRKLEWLIDKVLP